MPYTLQLPSLYMQTTPGATLTNSTTATDISTNPQFVMDPNQATTAGQTVILRAGGVFSSAASSPGNVTLGFYKNTQTTSGATGVGGTAIAATAATALPTSASNWIWTLEYWGTFTVVGSSGTLIGYGTCRLGSSATAVTVIPIPNATPQTAISINTLVGNLLTVGATFSTASASNSIICNQYFAGIAY